METHSGDTPINRFFSFWGAILTFASFGILVLFFVAFEATLTGPQTVLAQIEGSVGPGEPVGVELAIGFKLPPELFDDADFGAESPIDAAAWKTLWGDALSDHGGLEVVMTRNN